MSNYAYYDEERKNIIYSTEAVKEDRDKVFFCPNQNCSAQLYICAVDGSRRAYFRATKAKYRHTSNCPYGSSKVEFDENEFDQAQFTFDDAMDRICTETTARNNANTQTEHNKGEVKKHPPRTLRQIYSMCKSYPIDYKYGDKEIGEMLFDDRSESIYQNNWTGNRIIEGVTKAWFYDHGPKQIYLEAPLGSRKYSFDLNFSNYQTYRYIQNEIFNNQDKIIVVAGNWEKSDANGNYITVISSKKQISIIKR